MSVEVLRHDVGVSWVEDGALARAAHAVADDDRVWLIDPFADDAALEAVEALGSVVAVLQLLERHERDGRELAERFGAPFVVLPESLPDSPFETVPLLRTRRWYEIALWWPERRALIVPETIGTSPHYALDGGPAGVHALLRLLPPGQLRGYDPEHLLCGHGPPLHGLDAPHALRHAYAHSRRDLPRMALAAPRLLRAAVRAAWPGRRTSNGRH